MNNTVIALLALAVVLVLTVAFTTYLLKSKPAESAESRLKALLADAEKKVRSHELKFKHSPSVSEEERDVFNKAIQRRNGLKDELEKVRARTGAHAHA